MKKFNIISVMLFVVLTFALFTSGCASTPSYDPLTAGTIVPGMSLPIKMTWLRKNVESNNTYVLEIRGDMSISPQALEYAGLSGITIVLRGNDRNRTIRLSSDGSMFDVRPGVTFILENNISLHGREGNTSSLVRIEGGTFIMNAGSAITGNRADNGGGVAVYSGNFTMNGGTISGNTAAGGLGGGGVSVYGGVFTMNGGSISGNTANFSGGGVGVHEGAFTMNGGSISGNTAGNGGGVALYRGSFSMSDGSVSGNTARFGGGGLVLLFSETSFSKTGGTITGYASDPSDRGINNVVKDSNGFTPADKGHAVQVRSSGAGKRKETNAGHGVNLSFDGSTGEFTGEWDE